MAKYELSLTVNSANADVLTLDSDNFVLDVTPQAPVSLSVLELVGPRGETGPVGPTGPTGTTLLTGLTDVDSTSTVGQVLQSDGDDTFSFVDVVTTVDLGYTPAATTGTVTNDAGTDATIPAATTTNAGLLTGSDKTKLDGIETGATADQTGAEIKGLYELEANAFTDAQFTKLSGIEALADVTDATNVAAAGAVMESDTSTVNMSFVVDEDNMVSNSDTKVPTQQSVKAYVDANAAGGDVSKVGTPVDNQIGVWTGDGTIEGDADLTWDGSTFDITGDLTVSGTINTLQVNNGNGNDASSTAVGVDALINVNSGTANTAIGANALEDNTSGIRNTAIGQGALAQATTSSYNTAIGQGSMTAAVTGGNNTAIGADSLKVVTSGSNNMSIGRSSMAQNTTGSHNTAVGKTALGKNTTGSYNTALGSNALAVSSSGAVSNNVAIGSYALEGLNPGQNSNTAIGYFAGRYLDSGTENIIIGSDAEASTANMSNEITLGDDGDKSFRIPGSQFYINGGSEGSTGSRVGINTNAPTEQLDVSGNAVVSGTINGLQVNDGNGDDEFSTAVGVDALVSVNSGSLRNTAIGRSALEDNTSGERNTAIGEGAMANATTGGYNTAIGQAAMGSGVVTGQSNAAIGATALQNLTSGSFNMSIGRGSLANNTTGANNVAVGRNSLFRNTTGSNNVAIGSTALSLSSTGATINNVAIGNAALDGLDPGQNSNTAIGSGAGRDLNTGTENIIIGYNAEASTTDVSNEITFGDTGNKSFRIPGSSFYINGGSEGTVGSRVGINTTTPTEELDVNADAIRIRTAQTPASATAAGEAGTVCWDANYVYICVATNTWKRAALSTW